MDRASNTIFYPGLEDCFHSIDPKEEELEIALKVHPRELSTSAIPILPSIQKWRLTDRVLNTLRAATRVS